jgi:hypothetical protein
MSRIVTLTLSNLRRLLRTRLAIWLVTPAVLGFGILEAIGKISPVSSIGMLILTASAACFGQVLSDDRSGFMAGLRSLGISKTTHATSTIFTVLLLFLAFYVVRVLLFHVL